MPNNRKEFPKKARTIKIDYIINCAIVDFAKKTANQWLEQDFEKFMDYASLDAVIPLEAICSMFHCKNELYKRLADKKIVPAVTKPSFLRASF